MEFPREPKAMTSKRQNRSDSRHSTAALPADFSALLVDIKNRIRTAQIRASSSVNREQIQLYWDIGHLIGERQRAQGWGRSVSSGWPRTFRRVSLEWRDSAGYASWDNRCISWWAARTSTSICCSIT